MMKHGVLVALRIVAILLAMQGVPAAVAQEELQLAPDPIEGVWQTQLQSEITIAPCPEGFCGTLSKIIVPSDGLTAEEQAAAAAMDPAAFTDMRNKDPQLRDRPTVGLQILTLRPSTEPNIYDGEIYNPQDGNTYSGYVEMTGPDVARLNGCVLFNVVCKGEDWIRLPRPVAEQ